MLRFFILIGIFCISFVGWTLWSLDYGPLIYRHPAPEKLRLEYETYFKPYFRSVDIKSIRFGSNTATPNATVPVAIDAASPLKFDMRNPRTGAVYIVRNASTGRIDVYWDVPHSIPFSEAFILLKETTKFMITEHGRAISIQNTYD